MPTRAPGWIASPRGLRGKRAVVMGLGLQAGGLGVAEFLRDHGADLLVTDLRDERQLAPSVARLGHAGVRYRLGSHDPADFRQADLVIRNPAVPLDSPLLAEARGAGALVEMEMTLFLRWCRARTTVAVTGTRGKTTTASLLHAMLCAAGRPAALAGNMRVSALRQLDDIQPDSIVVLELSSWQVEGLAGSTLRTDGAVITNLLPDHLDRYATLEQYAAAKSVLIENQRGADWTVLPRDGRWGDWFARRAGARVLRFDPRGTAPGWAGARLRGEHNRANALAASVAAGALGVDSAAVAAALVGFPGVPERQQCLGVLDGVRLYDDTTATIPEATLAALDTIPGPWVLILGGSDKRLSFDALLARLRADPDVHALVLLPGAGADRLRPGLPQSRVIQAETMEAAVAAGLAAARPGDALLLSPACASFGLFTNEFDRGAQFRSALERRGLAPPSAGEASATLSG